MQATQIKEKVSRLRRTQHALSKVKAISSPALATEGESGPDGHLGAHVQFEEARAYQLEAECLQAKAQEMARRNSQRVV